MQLKLTPLSERQMPPCRYKDLFGVEARRERFTDTVEMSQQIFSINRYTSHCSGEDSPTVLTGQRRLCAQCL